jgi:branched-chain amino acid transport system substrate-binding protein
MEVTMPSRRITTIAAAFGLALIACGGSSGGGGGGSKADYALYFSSDLTGTTAGISQPMLSAIRAYIDYTNKHGGVNGHKLTLTALDDAMDPGRVKTNVQQAVNAGALAVLGANSSNGWSPNAPNIQQDQIPTIGLGFTDPQLDPPNNKFLYGLSPSYAQFVQLQMGLIQNTLIKNGSVPAKPKVAFYHYTSTAVTTMVTYQHQFIDQNGWTFTTEQSFPQAPTDVSAQAAAVAATHPDVVVTEVLDSHAPLVLNTLRQKGYTGPIVNFSAASAPATFAALKDPSYYGQVHFLNVTWTDQPGPKEVMDRAKSVGDTDYIDSGFYPFGWANAAAVVAAIKKCGDSCTAAKVNDALNDLGKVDVNGLNPNASYSPDKHRLAGAGIYYHWDSSKSAPEPVGTWINVS